MLGGQHLYLWIPEVDVQLSADGRVSEKAELDAMFIWWCSLLRGMANNPSITQVCVAASTLPGCIYLNPNTLNTGAGLRTVCSWDQQLEK